MADDELDETNDAPDRPAEDWDNEAEEEPQPDPPDNESGRGNHVVRNLRKALRAAKRELAERGAVNEEANNRAWLLERENAFLKADLPNTPGAEFFDRHYDGPLDAEAIRNAFESLDYRPPPLVPDEELAAHERVANASAGAPPATGRRLTIGSEEYQARLAKATSQKEVLAIMKEAGSPASEMS